uniref:ATP synthase complex subunit 8 n=1 Tax=Scolecomorphus vittatus TaxID=261001 RepID=Q64JQ4_SCOVT|nr:ATP synthase F0 subunit 8 [Scolecomorphus vittatus]AAS13735.1 ATP synthase F0 subunit 8 [Scolecomorphus vittatus]
MPQLNPAPWFLMLMVTWIVFLVLLCNKITHYKSFNDINTKKYNKSHEARNWPWY